MTFPVLLWLLIWGGMFTGLYNVTGAMFSSLLALFQGTRALFPLIALYICVMWMMVARVKFPSITNPTGLFFYYCITGLLISLLSPQKTIALYWGGIYLAPILLMWIVLSKEDALEEIKRIIYVNYYIAVFMVIILMPAALRPVSSVNRLMFYELPFGLGEIRASGVSRFALIVIIITMVRLIYQKRTRRFLLALTLIPSVYLIMLAQSRSTLFGLAIISVLFVYIMRFRWQLLLIGPASAYIVWVAGIERRAEQTIDLLVDLTGREFTWQQAFAQVKSSPFLGWGFHADRILLESQHIHNSYLHALMHGGIIGLLFFVGAICSTWYVIFKYKVLKRIREVAEEDQAILIESILIVGFLTARSFFESTAAFYGVDLLFFVPAAAFIYVYATQKLGVE